MKISSFKGSKDINIQQTLQAIQFSSQFYAVFSFSSHLRFRGEESGNVLGGPRRPDSSRGASQGLVLLEGDALGHAGGHLGVVHGLGVHLHVLVHAPKTSVTSRGCRGKSKNGGEDDKGEHLRGIILSPNQKKYEHEHNESKKNLQRFVKN